MTLLPGIEFKLELLPRKLALIEPVPLVAIKSCSRSNAFCMDGSTFAYMLSAKSGKCRFNPQKFLQTKEKKRLKLMSSCTPRFAYLRLYRLASLSASKMPFITLSFKFPANRSIVFVVQSSNSKPTISHNVDRISFDLDCV